MLPVVVLDDPEDAVPLALALVRGGLACAEVTLRTPHALKCIERIASAMADGQLPRHFGLGAGTVLNAEQAAAAATAGAYFLVSPGLDKGMWDVGAAAGLPVIPGIATATELQRAHNWGARLVKFFPAATSGGIAGLRALSAPFPDMQFMPTGGITEADASAWLALPTVPVIGGSWVVPARLLDQRDFSAIERLARGACGLGAGSASRTEEMKP